MNNRQTVVRQAYEQAIAQSDYLQNGISEFLPDSRIGRLELVTTGEYCDFDFDTVEIETIEQSVPQTVIDAFDRHVWFSQYCLTEIYVLKLPVADQETYAIAVSGLVGDGWDNACKFLDVFDTSGEFVVAVDVQGEILNWRDRPFDGDDFPTPASLWAERENGDRDRPPLWSEATATQIERNDALTRLFFFFAEE
ncbi:hypothetical protein K9N68_13360 [Kovacikia minuta CCNUW1]|uniref:hypothetical protein n=1 Tax=Kovacikia minuta TaxID=2931930 RepID=UPI001CCC1E5B|nr:hypothetical protein [Kovacikia minuta]UBF28740.1 hypothetical protein K9N68_13360 [Kovacikia minuta CCNUW1]